jgi:uncharacterized membrane protein
LIQNLLKTGILISLIAYPVAVHSNAILSEYNPGLAIFILILTLYGALLLLQQNHSGWLLLAAATLLCGFWIFAENIAGNILYLPPILINAMLFLLFSSTLFNGKTPLISRFAQQFHNRPLDRKALTYTRRVTQLWSGVFILMTIESLLLAIYASFETWSLFTNLINYIIILLVFVIEYWLRTIILPELDHPGFLRFMKSLRKFDIRSLINS